MQDLEIVKTKGEIPESQEQSTRKVVQELLESSLQQQNSLKSMASENAILRCLQKTEKIDSSSLNNFAFKTLKNLHQHGKNLSESQIAQAEIAIAILEDDFLKIGKYSLSSGMEHQVDFSSLSTQDKLSFKMLEYARKETSKRAQGLANCH